MEITIEFMVIPFLKQFKCEQVYIIIPDIISSLAWPIIKNTIYKLESEFLFLSYTYTDVNNNKIKLTRSLILIYYVLSI